MPPYGEPDWTTPGDTTNTASITAGVPIPLTSSGVSGGQNSNTADERCVRPLETKPFLRRTKNQ